MVRCGGNHGFVIRTAHFSILLPHFPHVSGQLFPRRGIKGFAFLPERQKISLLSLAQTAFSNETAYSSAVAPGQACKSCLTKRKACELNVLK
jgi:hypothetical protein